MRATFAEQAAKYAAQCLSVTALARKARGLKCERVADETAEPGGEWDDFSPDFGSWCTDRIRRERPEAPAQVPWWEATDEEIAACCMGCRARVEIWRDRYVLRKALGGYKRAMLAAFQREQKAAGA